MLNVSFHNDPQAWMYQRYSSGRGCIWRRPLVAVVGVLPSLQVAVSGRSVLLPRDSAAIRMCARAFNGLYSPGPLQAHRSGFCSAPFFSFPIHYMWLREVPARQER